MSTTIMRDAGDRLDAAALKIQKEEGIKDYVKALKIAGERDPELLHRYSYGRASDTKKYALEPIPRAMLLLQADPAEVRKRASAILDHHAKARASREGSVTPEAYTKAWKTLTDEFPSLGRAAEDGFISSSDYWLLAVLHPSVAGEVERVHGIKVHIYQRRANEVRRYSSEKNHVQYDANGNQYRSYSFDVR